MAVAIGSTDLQPYGDYATTSFISQSFNYTNTGTGNALLIQTIADYFTTQGSPWNGAVTVTYGGQTMTQDWSYNSGIYWYKTVKGFHLLNAPSGPNDVLITFAVNADYLNVAVCSVTGASTTSISSTSKSEYNGLITPPDPVYSTLTVPSASGNLVVAAAFAQADYAGAPIDYTNGSWITSPVNLTPYMAQYSGATSVSVTMGATTVIGDSSIEFIIGAWSIPPSGGVTPHAYVGYSGVANQVQTKPGNASGVVGNTNAGLGDDVAGSGVVDVYTGVS